MSSAPVASQEPVAFDVADGVATIELRRPERLNAYTEEMGERLLELVESARTRDDIRVVVIRGAGRAFCAGADLKVDRPTRFDGTQEIASGLRRRDNPLMSALRRLPKPVVAAVNGPAVGIGASLALSCDLVVAHEDAYFLFAFINVGLGPDGGPSALLPSNLSLVRAAELLMLGRRLPARDALSWGLVNRVFGAAEFDDAVRDFVAPLASGPGLALANIKQELRTWAQPGFEQQLELEARLQQERIAGSDDFAEGVAAFREKRPARFSGR